MPFVIIIKADYIILFEIFTVLNLDDLNGNLPGIFQAMFGRHGDICALIRMNIVYLVPVRYPRSPRNHDPVLAPVVMQLMRELCPWIDHNAFYLVSVAHLQHGI